ncbi:MAG: hypothetical protein AB7G68_16445 [Nitrospiraceae bacterium]
MIEIVHRRTTCVRKTSPAVRLIMQSGGLDLNLDSNLRSRPLMRRLIPQTARVD